MGRVGKDGREMVILHILVAILSLGGVSYAYVRPTATKFYLTYGLVGVTVLSGILLAVMVPARMAHVCMTGVVYIVVMSISILAARTKFKAARQRI